MGTTTRTVKKRLEEHKGNCRRAEIDRWAVAVPALQAGDHNIHFDRTQALAASSGYHERLYREAVEIVNYPKNLDRKKEGVKLNEIRIPVLKKMYTNVPPWGDSNSGRR